MGIHVSYEGQLSLTRTPSVNRLTAGAGLEVCCDCLEPGSAIVEHKFKLLVFLLTSKVDVVVEAHLLESDDVLCNARVSRHKHV